MKLHALTLTWNGEQKLQKLQFSLKRNFVQLKNDMDCIWHIRDNGSKDNTKALLTTYLWQSGLNLYEAGHNRDSFATCVNYLFQQANPNDDDLILLLNNDVIFNEEVSLLKMWSLMKKTNAAIVGARLMDNQNKLQHAGVIFSNQYGKMPWHYRRGEEADPAAHADRSFQAVTAAVCLMKASSFKRVGGMCEDYKWAFEDIDLCLRIGKDEKIVYAGETKITHEESATLKLNPVNKLFMGHNVDCFKKRWWSGAAPIYQIDHDLYLKNPKYNVID